MSQGRAGSARERHPRQDRGLVLLLAAAFWVVAAGAYTTIMVRALTEPVEGSTLAHATIQASAFLTLGFTLALVVAGLAAYSLLAKGMLLWIDVQARFEDVIYSTSPAFVGFGLFLVAGFLAVLLWPPQLDASRFGSLIAYERAFLQQQPFRLLHRVQPAVTFATAVAMMASLRRRTGCSRLEAFIAVGGSSVTIWCTLLLLQHLGAAIGPPGSPPM